MALEREIKLRFDSADEARTKILALGATPLHGRRLQEDALLDTDDFYWLPTAPPYQYKRPPDQRRALLSAAMDAADGFVSSGSLDGWGDPLIPRFAAVIFIRTGQALREARLRAKFSCNK